jgi:hypothetical protein
MTDFRIVPEQNVRQLINPDSGNLLVDNTNTVFPIVKSLVAGDNISLTETNNQLTIDSTATPQNTVYTKITPFTPTITGPFTKEGLYDIILHKLLITNDTNDSLCQLQFTIQGSLSAAGAGSQIAINFNPDTVANVIPDGSYNIVCNASSVGNAGDLNTTTGVAIYNPPFINLQLRPTTDNFTLTGDSYYVNVSLSFPVLSS